MEKRQKMEQQVVEQELNLLVEMTIRLENELSEMTQE